MCVYVCLRVWVGVCMFESVCMCVCMFEGLGGCVCLRVWVGVSVYV